jgi:hypothetical protein
VAGVRMPTITGLIIPATGAQWESELKTATAWVQLTVVRTLHRIALGCGSQWATAAVAVSITNSYCELTLDMQLYVGGAWFGERNTHTLLR